MNVCLVSTVDLLCSDTFQGGAFRVNCIDSLDRTNVVQSMLARRNLEMALRKMNVFQSERETISVDHPSFDSVSYDFFFRLFVRLKVKEVHVFALRFLSIVRFSAACGRITLTPSACSTLGPVLSRPTSLGSANERSPGLSTTVQTRPCVTTTTTFPTGFDRTGWISSSGGAQQILFRVKPIDYRCDNRRFWLSAHNCQVPTPTSQNLELEQQIQIFGDD